MVNSSTISEILSGWANNIKDSFGLLNPRIKVMSERRLLKCDGCYLRDMDRCSGNKYDLAVCTFMYKGKLRTKGKLYHGCGCDIIVKSKSEISKCPLGKWEDILKVSPS